MKLVSSTILFLCLFGCTLTSKQEQELNLQTSIYLNSIKNNETLIFVSKTHPEFVKYAKNKGSIFFKYVFSQDFEQFQFINLQVVELKKKNKEIHVLYEVERDYLYQGENKRDIFKFVAISEDKGENWFYLFYSTYLNRKICPEITRIIK